MNPLAEELNNVIKSINPSIFDMLSEKGKNIFFPKKGIIAQSAEANGKDINATIGMALEDNGEPMILNGLKKLINHQNAPKAFSYANSYGDMNLRKTWKEMIYKKNPGLSSQEISLPVVSNALTHGLSVCGYLFVDEFDSIISPDQYWENYGLIFSEAFSGEIETHATFSGNDYNVKAFSEVVLNHKKNKLIIILNFPNNPTGYTPKVNEVIQINEILLKAANSGKKLIVLCDDAYFGLGFEDNIIKESLFSSISKLHENILAVKLDGPTKEDYVWGFRVGFITFGIKSGTIELYNALEAKAAGAIRGSISNAPNISQFLLSDVYKNPEYENEKKQKFDTLKNRYLKVKEILQNHPEYSEHFTALPFNSGYFMCIELKKINAEKARAHLIQKYSVGVIAFGKLLRIAFSATPITKLENLFDAVYQACNDLK